MKTSIKVRIEDFPFTNISKHVINDAAMFILDEDLNLPEEKFILVGYKTDNGIIPYYVLNSANTQ